MLRATLATTLLALTPTTASAQPQPLNHYLVCVEPGVDNQYRPAAEAMAALHNGTVVEIDPSNIDALLELWQTQHPRYVVLVVPPSRIDVDWAHAILEAATKVDDDPFIDFQYAFITGRDGQAATNFVRAIERGWQRDFSNGNLDFLGTWEGAILPPQDAPMTAAKALGFNTRTTLVHTKWDEQKRTDAVRAALTDEQHKPDVSLFFSHGYPDQMVGCFTASQLQEWMPDFDASVLFNCACYNGAPARWWEPTAFGFSDRGSIDPENSVALAILDANVSAYFAGVDPWHGPLTNQVFEYVCDDGLSLGAAAKTMYDRLAMAFAPEPIHYPPTVQRGPMREGTENRRSNAAGMILYGDPAFAPLAATAPRLWTTTFSPDEKNETATITITGNPLIAGPPGMLDFMLPQARFMDYYSVKTPDVMHELNFEVYRTIPLPPTFSTIRKISIESARGPDKPLPVGAPQFLVEKTNDGPVLHLRIPIPAPALGDITLINLARNGFEMSLTAVAK